MVEQQAELIFLCVNIKVKVQKHSRLENLLQLYTNTETKSMNEHNYFFFLNERKYNFGYLE